jgi:hypothetical protein
MLSITDMTPQGLMNRIMELTGMGAL